MSPEAILGALGVLGFLGMLFLAYRIGRVTENRDQRARLLAVDSEVAELIQKFTSHVKREAGAKGREVAATNRAAAPIGMGGVMDVETARAQARNVFRQRDAAGGKGA